MHIQLSPEQIKIIAERYNLENPPKNTEAKVDTNAVRRAAFEDVCAFIRNHDLEEDCGRLITTPRPSHKSISTRNTAWVEGIRRKFM